MENALKGLMLAAGLVITCMVVAFGFYTAREAKGMGQSAVLMLNEMAEELSEQGITRYDGLSLRGSEVINAVKRYQDSIPMMVETEGGCVTFRGEFRTADNTAGSERYIRASRVYTGSVVRDGNGGIRGMEFWLEGAE